MTGFTSTAANLLSVPVYAWGCLVTLFVGFFGDRIGQRAYLNMYVSVMGLKQAFRVEINAFPRALFAGGWSHSVA